MNRKVRPGTGRRALLGDRAHTQRIAGRAGLAAFLVTIMILSPLAYGLVAARGGRSEPPGAMDMILVGMVVVGAAFGVAFAANVVVHLLGREARARRSR